MARVTTSGFAAVDRALADMGKRVDSATPVMLRAAAKVAVDTARQHVRVYAGDRPDVPKGRLRKSLKAGRVRKAGGVNVWSVTVSPQGWPATGYAGRIEADEPYMAPAGKAAEAALGGLALQAWSRAMGR